MPHRETLAVLAERIADRAFLRLIARMLKAGVQTPGGVVYDELGSPQGSIVSPVIANVFLDHVLDQWFATVVRQHCRGYCILLRYTYCISSFDPRLHHLTYCYYNRFLPASNTSIPMRGGEKMTPVWAQRREELLSDCLVSPDVFKQMVDRLGAFVVPYQQALEAEAGPHPMQLYLQGLLAHLPRKNAEDIAIWVDVERQVIQDFIGTAPWDHRPLVTV
jgi:hypothetical protein